MPMDKRKYPSNWAEIATAAKDRAVWVCEWCGVPHDARIVRDPQDGSRYELLEDTAGTATALDGRRVTRVVLTVHHIGVDRPDGTPGDMEDKLDCRPENLAALCQRCHLLADLDGHVRNAALTRRRKRVEAGQLEMAL